MKRIKPASWIIWLIIISGFMFTFQSCDVDAIQDKKEQKIALNAYNKVIKYARAHHTESGTGHRTGYVEGPAKFNYGESSITVTYSALQQTATENGALKRMSVLAKDDPRDVGIYGLWDPYGSGSGTISVFLSKDDFLCVVIEGGYNWKYWDNYKLDSPDYVLEVFADAAKKIARLENNSMEARELAREEKREQRKRNNVKTPLQEGVYYVLDRHFDDSNDYRSEIYIIMPINGGTEFYDYEINRDVLSGSDGRKFISFDRLLKYAVVGKGEFRLVEKLYGDERNAGLDRFQRMRADNKGNIRTKWKNDFNILTKWMYRLKYNYKDEKLLFVKTDDLSEYNIPSVLIPSPEEARADSQLDYHIQRDKYTIEESDIEGGYDAVIYY